MLRKCQVSAADDEVTAAISPTIISMMKNDEDDANLAQITIPSIDGSSRLMMTSPM